MGDYFVFHNSYNGPAGKQGKKVITLSFINCCQTIIYFCVIILLEFLDNIQVHILGLILF